MPKDFILYSLTFTIH